MKSPRWRPVHATSHRHALGMLFLRIFASYVAYWGRQHGPRGIVAAGPEVAPETYAPS